MYYNSRSKYSKEVNSELEFRTLRVLGCSQEALSIADIKTRDLVLADYTPQKMARVLNTLIDMGMVKSGKSKSNGRMLYKSVGVMKEQGYDV